MDSSTTLSQDSPIQGNDSISEPKTWRVGTLTYTATGIVVLFAWLLWADFAWAMKDRSISSVFQIMLNKHGASNAVSGWLMGSLPAMVGLFVGPIISYKSDRHRGRWGRRLPYLFATIPFITGAMIGLGLSPWIGSRLNAILGARSPGLNPCVILSFACFWTIYDFASVASGAVFAGLLNDVVPQTLVGRFFGAWRAISLLVGIGFNWTMMGSAAAHYQFIFIGFGLIFGIGLMLMCFNVKEGAYPPPNGGSGKKEGFVLATTKYFKECFGRTYYLWFYVAISLAMTATTVVNLFTVYYADHVGMSTGYYGKCIAITYVFSLFLAYPLGWAADKFHPLRVVIIAVISYAIVVLVGGIFVRNAFTFAIALIAHGVFSGSLFTASASLGLRLLPREKFAEYTSAAGIVGAFCTMVFSPLIGFLLDAVNHDYRYTFYLAAILSFAAAAGLLVLHSKFMKLGGPKNYVAPQ